MAVVGDAYVVVRALTGQVRDDIKKGMNGVDSDFEKSGKDSGDRFNKGLTSSLGGSGGAFKGLQREAEGAREKLNGLIQTGYFLGPAIAGLVGALGAAGAGLFALGAQAASAGPALLSLGNIFASLAQAGGVLKMVFSGVGAAIAAGSKQASSGGGKNLKDLKKQLEALKERADDARKAYAIALEDAAWAEQNAAERVSNAREAEAEAYQAIGLAKQNEVEAQLDVIKALNDVNEAREQAIESIQQLRFQLEESVLSEKRAALGLEDARKELARVSNLPPNNRRRREAELAFAEAELRLRRAKDSTNDTQKAVDKANAKGVEGSDQVVAAQERVIRAQKAAASATRSVEEAEKRYEQAKKDTIKATAEYNRLVARSAAQLVELDEAVKDADQAVKDFKDTMNDGGGGGGVDKFAEAMSKLSPNAQEFVREILGIKDKFGELKKAAQEEFFGKFNGSLKELTDVYFPLLESKIPKTAGLLGEIAKGITDAFKTPENVERFERIWDSNDKIIGSLGDAVTDLVDVFLILMDAAAPVAERFAKWIKVLTGGWKETLENKEATGKLAETFKYAGDVAAQLGRVFGSLFRTISNLGKAAAGPGSGGEMLLDSLEKVTKKWEIFTGSAEGQNTLAKFFKDASIVAKEIFGLIGDIFGEIGRTTKAGVEGGEKSPLFSFFSSLRDAVKNVGETGPQLISVLPTIGKIIADFAEVVKNLTASGAIQKFFEVIGAAVGFLKSLTGNPVFQEIFKVVAPIFAIGRGLGLILSVAKFLFLGAILGNIFAFVNFFVALQTLATGPVGTFLGKAKLLAPIFTAIGSISVGPVLAVIAAIAGVVLIFVALWRESEKFRDAVKEYFVETWNTIKGVFEDLKKKLDDALAPIGGLEGGVERLKLVFKTIGDILAVTVIPLFQWLVGTFWKGIGFVLGLVIDFIGFIIKMLVAYYEATQPVRDALVVIWNAIYAAVEKVVIWFKDTALPIITDFIDGIKSKFETGLGVVKRIWDEIYSKIETVVNGIWTFLWPIIDLVWTLIQKGVGAVWEKIKSDFDNAKAKIDAVFSWARDTAWPMIQSVWENIKNAVTSLRDKIREIFDSIKEKISNVFNWAKEIATPIIEGVWDRVKGPLQPLLDKVKEVFDGIKTKVSEVVDAIKGFLSGVWDGLGTGLQKALGGVKSLINGLVDGLNLLIKGFNAVAGWAGSDPMPYLTPPFPEFARGGIVMPRAGGTLGVIAEAGRPERIEPLDPDGLSKRDKAMINFLTGGAGGATINVYPSQGMNERELAQLVSKEMASLVRRGAL